MSASPIRYGSAIVACARWECPYVEEWIRYHLALGFDHIYLYCNDDDPAPFKKVLRGLPAEVAAAVSFTPFSGQGRQADMYRDALPRARRDAEWICFLDVDEFIVLKAWASIGALTRDLTRRGIGSLHLNWLFYGNNGHETRPAGAVLDTYLRRARTLDPHTKHLTRAAWLEPDRLARAPFPFWHGLTDPHWCGFDRRNAVGDPVGPLLDAFPQAMTAYLGDDGRTAAILDTAYVAHFAFKSRDDFRLRVARGLGGNFGGQIKWAHALATGGADAILAGMNEVLDPVARVA